MGNKYVDFVSDEDFIECVKWVCDAYPENVDEIDMKRLSRNGLDPIKQIFDILGSKISGKDWIRKENTRQYDKTISNRIGDFHQRLLGKVEGWIDLGRGHPLGIDLQKDDNSIFIELKNKHNTVKGEDHKNVWDKLKKVLDESPNSLIYYAYIIPKKPSSGEKIWNPSQRDPNENILEAWGSKVYEIVTGDPKSLKKTWKALPIAINDIFNQKNPLTDEDYKIIEEFFETYLGE